jgi:hypothetical protein
MREYTNFEYDNELIREKAAPDTKIIVVIPSFNERDIEVSLQSIADADSLPEGKVEVIVVINESENAPDDLVKFHDLQCRQLREKWGSAYAPAFTFHFIRAASLPAKKAGVGLARKIGMDEAAKRFISIDHTGGIIASLDADVCIAGNYFTALDMTYRKDEKLRAAGVYFEHDLKELEAGPKEAIIDYELHLRYHINMQRYLQLPYAYYTVGSAMSVRASSYLAHFGMNKRQAGEDFYFLHKYIKTGYYKEILSTTVYPSARISERVPFGTGQAIQQIGQGPEELKSYDSESYLYLQPLLIFLELYFVSPKRGEEAFLDTKLYACFGEELLKNLKEIKRHTDSMYSFQKRFFHWFDAFRLIKYLHFMRDNQNPNVPISKAVEVLFSLKKMHLPENKEKQLQALRAMDREAYLTPPFATLKKL